MEYRTIANLTDEQRESVVALLRAYDVATNPAFFAKREMPENARRPLAIVACDEAGKIIGGLLGETQFAWLHVTILAVDQHARRRGVGRKLMELAEKEAMARGCRHVYLDTMEFQAPGFYPKFGYELVGRLENWDSHGHAKYFYTKRLTAGPPPQSSP